MCLDLGFAKYKQLFIDSINDAIIFYKKLSPQLEI